METAKYEVMAPVMDLADVKKYIAPNASDKELFMFMNISKAYGLNPVKREVHFIKYGTNPGQIVVGYEMYLKRAESTGLLDGWEVKTLDEGTPHERAQITIYRKDRSRPFVWEVSRKEFDKGQSTWKLMPSFMLKKVAISQGFRLCFPEQLGGMPYSVEEINGKGSEELPRAHVEEALPEQIPAPAPEPPKGKSLFEQLNTARGTFHSLVMDNLEKMKDFLPDEMATIRTRWMRAAAAGAGGVPKDAPWPLDEKKDATPPIVEGLEESMDAETADFVKEAEEYKAALKDESWALILQLYSMKPNQALSTLLPGYRQAFLTRCKGQLDKQNNA